MSFLYNTKYFIQICQPLNMKEIKNRSSKSEHKEKLKSVRIKRLEEKMKLNIKKRKKIIINNNG